MHTLESLQRAINTTDDLQSIVRTMKVLASVSIRQYERAVESLRDYRRTVDLGMQAIAEQNRFLSNTHAEKKTVGLGVIIFGSDHGLCGRFNDSITNFSINKIEGYDVPVEQRRVLIVGARASVAMEARGIATEECFFVPGSVAGITSSVRQIVTKLVAWQTEGVEEILLFYNRHRSGSSHQPNMERLLPVRFNRFSRLTKRNWPSRSIPAYSMSQQQLFSSLVRQYLFISIFRACAESLASEHASRLVSMQIAEKNIKERMSDLEMQFRQQRQNEITEELLDVISGFEVLSQKKSG